MDIEALKGLCKLLFSMMCLWGGLAILMTIPVVIYFFIQEKKEEIEE